MKHAPIIDIEETKTHLSYLVEQAAQGDSFVIAKAGKPLVKVVAIEACTMTQQNRFGFMAGYIKVPDDFDQMGEQEIKQLFTKTKA